MVDNNLTDLFRDIIELKFNAPDTQTEVYCHATHINGQSVEAYDGGQHYLYLHRRDRPDSDGACFEKWTWQRFLEDEHEPFVQRHLARFPARTVEQLLQFADDLIDIADMDDQDTKPEMKEALYFEHREAITAVTEAFEHRWSRFADEWHVMLARQLAAEHPVEAHVDSLPPIMTSTVDEDNRELFAAIDVSDIADEPDLWTFRALQDDWSHLFREGWWRRQTDLETPIYDRLGGNDIRVGFHHRLGRHRDVALEDGTLILYFRNMGANPNEFIAVFNEIMDDRRHDIEAALPASAEWLGNRSDRIRATYAFDVDDYDGFYANYVNALATAFAELVIENDQLIALLDACYYDALERVYDVRLK